MHVNIYRYICIYIVCTLLFIYILIYIYKFDIEEFYPSISKGLLMKAINHTKSFVTISKEEVKTIMHSRKSLLFNITSVLHPGSLMAR